LPYQGDTDDRTAAEIGDLMGRMISLRQMSVSVARALTDGRDAAARRHGEGPRHPSRSPSTPPPT
jgi:hypothetical protein